MNTKQEAKLLKAWGALSDTGKRHIMEYIEVTAEMERPAYRAEAAARDEEMRFKLAKVETLKEQIEKANKDARAVLLSFLPSKDAQSLLMRFELLTFLSFASVYQPYYFLENEGQTASLARKMISSIPRLLVKMKGKPA